MHIKFEAVSCIQGNREKDVATVHVSTSAKFLRGIKSGHGGGAKETQGATGVHSDILLFPSAQILMRLEKCFNEKSYCLQVSPKDFLSSSPPFFPPSPSYFPSSSHTNGYH